MLLRIFIIALCWIVPLPLWVSIVGTIVCGLDIAKKLKLF